MTVDNKSQTPTQQEQELSPVKQRRATLALVFAFIAMLMAIGMSIAFTRLGQERLKQVEDARQALQTSLNGAVEKQQQLADTLESATHEIATLKSSELRLRDVQQELLAQMQQRQDKTPASWVLSEADYLLKMAAHKLWLEHDLRTAQLLLRAADQRLASLHDPALLDVRKALAHDETILQGLKAPDREGIALELNALIAQIPQLPLLHPSEKTPTSPSPSPSALSSSLADWKENLSKSWQQFMGDFITIRRSHGQAKPLLSPQQDWFLRENLKLTLFQAQQATYREQTAVYQQSLSEARQWIKNYFLADDAKVQGVMDQLSRLAAEPITIEYPDQFSAMPLLNQILTQRLAGQSPN